jgi:hypothetical protein
MYMMANAAVFPTYAMNTIVVVECVRLIPLETFQSDRSQISPESTDGTTMFIGGQASASV